MLSDDGESVGDVLVKRFWDCAHTVFYLLNLTSPKMLFCLSFCSSLQVQCPLAAFLSLSVFQTKF